MLRRILIFSLLLPAAAFCGGLELEEIFVHDTYVKKAPSGMRWEEDPIVLTWMVKEENVIHRFDPQTRKMGQMEFPEKLRSLEITGSQAVKGGAGRLVFTEEQTYWIHPDRGVLELPEGENHTASPWGTYVAYTRQGNLYLYHPVSGEKQITEDGNELSFYGKTDWVYGEELGMDRGVWFSPDEAWMAFLHFDENDVPAHPIVDYSVSHPEVTYQRYPLAGDPNPVVRLALMRLPAGDVTWHPLPDENGYLAGVHFSPDSRFLFIQVLNRLQTELTLLRMDCDTGRWISLLTETDPHWVNTGDILFPLQGGDFLWTSESSGYRHIFRYDASGKMQKQLTRGDWAVTSVDWVAKDGSEVIFTATDPSPRERHVYHLDTATGTRTHITPQPGWHSVEVSENGLYFLDRYSRWNRPTQYWVMNRETQSKTKVFDLAALAFQDLRVPAPEPISVRSEAGIVYPAQVLKPSTPVPERGYPVLHYVYGGFHAQVARDRWRLTNLWYVYLARKGVMVFMMDNRGAGGMGKTWEVAPYGELGRIELQDQLEGVKYLKSLPEVDPERIAVWGWSYGGYLTLYALTHCDAYALGMAVAPVTDWRLYDSIYTERYMKLPEENEEGYRLSSPIHDVENLRRPLLVAHGTSDNNVHIVNTMQFVDRLIDAGKNYNLFVYPGKSHSIKGKSDRLHLFSNLTRFLTEHLLQEKNKPAEKTAGEDRQSSE